MSDVEFFLDFYRSKQYCEYFVDCFSDCFVDCSFLIFEFRFLLYHLCVFYRSIQDVRGGPQELPGCIPVFYSIEYTSLRIN